MAHSLVRFKIADYEQWLTAFNGMGDLRAQYGCEGGHAFMNVDNPAEIVVLLHWADEAQARAYTTSPDLRAAMQAGGVQGPPEITFLDEVGDAQI